ncbi:MAG: hypothetical protein ACN6NI_07680 [Acinetobacter sp.]
MLNYFVSIIIGSLLFSNAWAAEKFVCKTSTHTVLINPLSSGQYKYTAWNKPKNMADKPDLVIMRGKQLIEGTGACRYTRWEFNHGNTQYVLSTPVTCTESIPPANAIGELSIFINDALRKSSWCLK